MTENLGNATLYLGTDDSAMQLGLERNKTAVQGAMQTMRAVALATGSGVAASFSAAWTASQQTIALIEGGISGLVASFGVIPAWLSQHAGDIPAFFGNAWRTIHPMTLNMIQAVGDITSAWSEIQGWFITLWNNVGAAFADAWQSITALLFPTPSYAERIRSAWGGIVHTIAALFRDGGNAAIDVLNQLVRMMNRALRHWNDLSFSVRGFGRTFTDPFTGAEIGGVSWPGVHLSTPNVPLVPSLPKFRAVGADVGALFMQPTLAAIAEGGEPEAVFPLSRLPEFTRAIDGGSGGRGRAAELHIHVENAYGVDNLVDQINEAWLDGRLRGLQDQLAGAG